MGSDQSGDWWDEVSDGSDPDEMFDEELRWMLAQGVPPSASPPDSYDVFAELMPSMRRARRRYRAGQVVAGSAVMFTVVVGVTLGADLLTSSDGDLLVAVPPAPDPTPAENRDQAVSTSQPLLPPGSETAAAAPYGTGPGDAGGGEPAGAPTTPPPRSASPPLPAGGPSTSIVRPVPATFTIESSCGDVVVGISGPVLDVLDVQPAGGVQPGVKSAGPETVEVSFEGGGRHCELVAKVTSEGLWISVDNDAAPSPVDGEREGEGEEG